MADERLNGVSLVVRIDRLNTSIKSIDIYAAVKNFFGIRNLKKGSTAIQLCTVINFIEELESDLMDAEYREIMLEKQNEFLMSIIKNLKDEIHELRVGRSIYKF